MNQLPLELNKHFDGVVISTINDVALMIVEDDIRDLKR